MAANNAIMWYNLARTNLDSAATRLRSINDDAAASAVDTALDDILAGRPAASTTNTAPLSSDEEAMRLLAEAWRFFSNGNHDVEADRVKALGEEIFGAAAWGEALVEEIANF